MHPSAFDHLKPSDEQLADMTRLRESAAKYAHELEEILPDGPDKTYIMRQLRTVAMWVNVALTRHADGAPRQ